MIKNSTTIQALTNWRTEKARQMLALNVAQGWRRVDSPAIPTPVMAQGAFGGYPRPKNLSKRGMHWSASCYPEEHGWRNNLALCRDMGIGFIKFVDDGGASGLNVYRACWHEFGIVPVIRFYIGTPGHCGMRESDAIKRISDQLGFATYFELENEPDLPIEWDWHQPKNWLYQSCDAFCDYAPKVLAAGGLPGTPALASGAFGQLRIDQHGNEIPPTKVNFLKLITDKIGTWIFKEGGWVSMHNYPINHPVDYPYDEVNQTGRPLTQAEYDAAPPWAWDHRPMADINAQRLRDQNPGDDIWDDDTCLRAYMPFQQHLAEIGCTDTPLLTTEGGYTMTRGDDGRYPKVHEALQAAGTERIYREIGPIPNYYAHCDWLLYNTTGGWATDCRVGGSHSYALSIDLMKRTPVGAWGEKFGQQAPPQQPPDEEPDEEPEPPPVVEPPAPEEPAPLPAVVYEPADVLARYGLTLRPAEVTPGETYWRITRVRHLPGSENNGNHHLYVDVLDRNGQRVNGAKVAVAWTNGAGVLTIDKPPNEPGSNCPLYLHQVASANVLSELDSDRIEGVHTGHTDEPPGNTFGHHSFLVEWREADAADPEPPDEPPPVEVTPVEITDEDVRNAAWNALGIAYVPGNALQEYAKAHDFGRPVTNEIDVNDAVRFQAFERMILWCPIGDFLNIHETEWH